MTLSDFDNIHSFRHCSIADAATAVSSSGCGSNTDGRQLVDGGGGPTVEELLRLLDQCDLSNSLCSTPCQSPFVGDVMSAGGGGSGFLPRIKTTNVAFLNQMRDRLMMGSTGSQLGPSNTAQPSQPSSSGANAMSSSGGGVSSTGNE